MNKSRPWSLYAEVEHDDGFLDGERIKKNFHIFVHIHFGGQICWSVMLPVNSTLVACLFN